MSEENNRFSKEEKERAKAVSIIELAQSLGLDVGKDKKALCFGGHDSATKSLSFDVGTNLFKCFGCGEGGDTIELVRKIKGCSFVEAMEHILGGKQCQRPYIPLQAPIRAANGRGENFGDIYEYFIKILPFPDEHCYLIKDRYLSSEVLINNNIKAIDQNQTWNYKDKLLECFPIERLIKSGLISISKKSNGYLFFYECCAVIPFYKDERIIYLQGITRPELRAKGKVRNLPDIEKTYFYFPKLSNEGPIHLVEGIISALYYTTFGDDSIALLSGTAIKEGLIKELLPYKNREFLLVPDVDFAGKQAFEKLKDLLFKNGFKYNPEMISSKQIGRELGATEKELNNVKDINDLRRLL